MKQTLHTAIHSRSQPFGALGRAVAAGMLVVGGLAMAQGSAVPTALVQSKAVGAMVEFDGVIEPVKQSTVSAQAAGIIATLQVKAGDKVRAGQTLATIDDREASAGMQRSQAQVNQTEAELRNARSNQERTKDLQGKGFVSKAALDSADAQYQSALAMHEQSKAGALQSRISQGFTRVTAPFDGWVLQLHAQTGDLAVPGKPLLTVYAPQPLRAVVQVPASRSQSAKNATQTTVKVETEQGKSFWITPVNRVAIPAADPVSQTTEWRLELPAREAIGLVPGQQVRVQFLQGLTGSVERLLVPQVAVVRRGELTAVYVAIGQDFSLRAVRLGARQGADMVEVLAGVVAGDKVALDPVRAGAATVPTVQSGK